MDKGAPCDPICSSMGILIFLSKFALVALKTLVYEHPRQHCRYPDRRQYELLGQNNILLFLNTGTHLRPPRRWNPCPQP